MKKGIALLLAVLLLALTGAAALSDEAQGTDMYVYTKNGKVLLVRSSMSTKDNTNVIGSLPYGAKVVIYGHRDGWAMIDYGNTIGYIMYRFLSKQKPEPFAGSTAGAKTETAKAEATAAPAETAPADTGLSAATVDELNALLDSAVFVTPYTVTTRPIRASGWATMRWFPTTNAKEMGTFGANYELTVIAELEGWLQVSDPATGMVGFVNRTLVQ